MIDSQNKSEFLPFVGKQDTFYLPGLDLPMHMNHMTMPLVIYFMGLQKAEICSPIDTSLPVEEFGVILLEEDVLILEHRLVVLYE